MSLTIFEGSLSTFKNDMQLTFWPLTYLCYKYVLSLEKCGKPSHYFIPCFLLLFSRFNFDIFCRVHIVNQFNEGLYDYIIASDETLLADPSKKPTTESKKK